MIFAGFAIFYLGTNTGANTIDVGMFVGMYFLFSWLSTIIIWLNSSYCAVNQLLGRAQAVLVTDITMPFEHYQLPTNKKDGYDHLVLTNSDFRTPWLFADLSSLLNTIPSNF